jgi:hypothetical protein
VSGSRTVHFAVAGKGKLLSSAVRARRKQALREDIELEDRGLESYRQLFRAKSSLGEQNV